MRKAREGAVGVRNEERRYLEGRKWMGKSVAVLQCCSSFYDYD